MKVISDKQKRLLNVIEYALNKKIFNDNFRYCHKCPGVIRNVFKKVKMYYDKKKEIN